MVSVYFGNDKESEFDPDVRFNNSYKEEWFDDPIVRKMIKDIDNTDVISSHCIMSPVLGQIAPYYLSGGVKGCIMLYKDETYYPNLVIFGQNCQSWLSWIFQQRDIVRVAMSGYDLEFEGCDIQGVCENDGSMINNSRDWVQRMLIMVGDPRYER